MVEELGLFGDGVPSVVEGFGLGLLGAVPGGVFSGAGVVGVDESGGVVVVALDEGDVDGSLDGATVGVPETDALPVVEVVGGFDIELSVFGVSGLLQALSAATAVRVAAMAI